MAVVVGHLQVRFDAATAAFQNKVKRVNRSLRGVREAGLAAAGAGAALGGLSAALGGVARGAGRASLELGRGMANVATLLPPGIARVQELKARVQDLAGAHGRTSQDLVAGLYDTISVFGDRAGQTMQVLRINSMAATAGVATVKDAIGLTSAITKGYGDTTAAAVQKASDLAFQTVKMGKTTFPELAAAIGRVVPFAAQLGVRQEELAASYATLTGVTGNAAEVSTQMRGVLSGLIRPSKGLREALDQLGVSSAGALLEQRGLKGALDALVGTTDGSTEAVGRLFGSADALGAVLQITGGQAASFEEKLAAMENAAGATERAFTAQTEGINTAGHRWNQLKAILVTVQERLGDILIPVLLRAAESLRPLLDVVVEAVGWFGRLPQPIQTGAVALAALVPVASGFLLLLGGLASGLAGAMPLLTGLGSGLAALVPSAAGLAKVLGGLKVAVAVLGGPVTLAGAALAALLVGTADGRRLLGGLARLVKGVVVAAFVRLRDAVGWVGDKLAAVMDRMRSFGGAVKSALPSWVTGAFGGLADTVHGAADALDAANRSAERTRDVAAGLVGPVLDAGAAADDAGGAAGGAADRVEDLGAAAGEASGVAGELAGAVEGVADAAEDADDALEPLAGGVTVLSDRLAELRARTRSAVDALIGSQGLIGASQFQVPDWFAGIPAAAEGVAIDIPFRPEYGGPPPPPPRTWFDRAQEAGARWRQTFARALEGGGGIRGAIGSLLTTELGGALAGSLAGAAGRIEQGITSLVGRLSGGLGGLLKTAIGSLVPIIGPLLGSLAGPLMRGLAGLGKRIGGTFRRLFGGPSAAETAGRDAWRSYADGLAAGASSGQIAEAAAAGWKNAADAQAWIVFRDQATAAGKSTAEAERLWQRFVAAIKRGPDAIAAVTAEMDAVREAAAAATAEQERLAAEQAQIAEGLAGLADAGREAFDPAQLEPYLAQMERLGLLTADEAAAMRRLADDAHVDWRGMQEAAERYGVELSALGPAFDQARLSEAAAQIVTDFELLTAEGADVNAVLDGMQDEVQELVNRALTAGVAIPEGMRPIIESLVEQGRLTGANGEKLTDLSGLEFATPIADKFDTLIDKIQAMIVALGGEAGLGAEVTALADGAGADVARMAADWAAMSADAKAQFGTFSAFVRDQIKTLPSEHTIRVRGVYHPPDIGGNAGTSGEGVTPLARGGIVHRPTLALIGEGGHSEAVVPLSGPSAPGTLDLGLLHQDLQALRRDLREATDPHRVTRAWQEARAFE